MTIIMELPTPKGKASSSQLQWLSNEGPNEIVVVKFYMMLTCKVTVWVYEFRPSSRTSIRISNTPITRLLQTAHKFRHVPIHELIRTVIDTHHNSNENINPDLRFTRESLTRRTFCLTVQNWCRSLTTFSLGSINPVKNRTLTSLRSNHEKMLCCRSWNRSKNSETNGFRRSRRMLTWSNWHLSITTNRSSMMT